MQELDLVNIIQGKVFLIIRFLVIIHMFMLALPELFSDQLYYIPICMI